MQNGHSKKQLRVAYLGPQASFSNQAAAQAFPPETNATLHALPSFKDLFSAIQKSTSGSKEPFDYAVVPAENSTNGGVVQVLDYLIQCGLDPSSCLFPDVEVVAEHYLEVHHCIYIHPSSITSNNRTMTTQRQGDISTLTVSNVPIEDLNITTLYTHPQVWGQCHKFLFKHFSPATLDRIDMSSTSAAATFVAKNPPSHPAPDGIPGAICSSLAGVQNGLVQVAHNIEDEPGKNTTRFLIIRNAHFTSPIPAHLLQPVPSPSQRPKHHKSLLTFTTPHDVPGSLASALAVFQKHGFNLTVITSRPSRERNWHYVFFVECEKEATNGETRPVHTKQLLQDLESITERTCWLGSWVDRLRHV